MTIYIPELHTKKHMLPNEKQQRYPPRHPSNSSPQIFFL